MQPSNHEPVPSPIGPAGPFFSEVQTAKQTTQQQDNHSNIQRRSAVEGDPVVCHGRPARASAVATRIGRLRSLARSPLIDRSIDARSYAPLTMCSGNESGSDRANSRYSHVLPGLSWWRLAGAVAWLWAALSGLGWFEEVPAVLLQALIVFLSGELVVAVSVRPLDDVQR